MKTGTKIAFWLAGIAIVGVGSYFIYRQVKKSRQKKTFQPPLSESQLKQTEKSFQDYLDKSKKKQDSTTLIANTQPKGFAQTGGFQSPSSVNPQSSLFQKIIPINFNLPNRV